MSPRKGRWQRKPPKLKPGQKAWGVYIESTSRLVEPSRHPYDHPCMRWWSVPITPPAPPKPKRKP